MAEMVLLAMLPEEDAVMLVQTPCSRIISDLEDFIVDEYSRVFPHLSPLSRNLRIQKCVAPDLVMDRRAHTTVRQEAPHVFVDLAKNVQAGNVFENMEQIYIVVNEPKKLTHLKTKKNATEGHSTSSKLNVVQRSRVNTKEALDNKVEAMEKKALKKTAAEKKERTAKKHAVDSAKRISSITDEVKSCDAKIIEKATTGDNEDGKKASLKAVKKTAEKKSHDATNGGAGEVHEKSSSKKHRNTKVAAGEEVQGLKTTAKKSLKGLRNATQETTASSRIIDEDGSAASSASKKTAPKKSGNALLQKMLAAKQDAASSGAALVADSLLRGDGDVAPKSKSEKTRKSCDQKAPATKNTLDAREPPVKKKKSAAEVIDQPTRVFQAISDEQTERVVLPGKKKATVEVPMKAIPSTSSETVNVSKKKVANKSVEKASDDSSTASESTSHTRKLKKKIENEAGDVDLPVVKRAKKEVSASVDTANDNANLAKKVSKRTKSTESVTATILSRSSSESSSSSTQTGEPVISDETEVVERPNVEIAATLSRRKKPHDETTSETPKLKLQTILSKTKKQIAKGKEDRADAENTDDSVEQTSKVVESTATASSSDSDAPPVVVKVKKRYLKASAPVRSSSSSSSDEDELDYSQSLLADLTKDDAAESVVASVDAENNKKSKEIVSHASSSGLLQKIEHSQDPLSSELTQKSQESNSVLLPTLSRNQFSLGSMPVAKLKKSSKNPFSSPKKATAKTARPRGRPRKVDKV